MKPRSTRQSKSSSELSDTELRAELERISGLPCPVRGEPNEREKWAQYEVAANIILEMRGDPDPDRAKRNAVNWVMNNHAYPLDELAPHIERAMGRKLWADELAARQLRGG